MVCRSTINGVSLGEKLFELTVNELQCATEGKNSSPSWTTEKLLNAISTSSRAMGHTTEAAQFARMSCFAMADSFGLNSLFLTTTPCDECTFWIGFIRKLKSGGVVEFTSENYLQNVIILFELKKLFKFQF